MNLETKKFKVGTVFHLNGITELILAEYKGQYLLTCWIYGVWKIDKSRVHDYAKIILE